LKASWGKSFKAPTLAQQNKLREGHLLPGDFFVPAPGDGRPILVLGGAAPDLKPEKATTWTATLTLTPRFVEGLRLEASYFHTRYRDRVVEPAGGGDQVFGSDIYRALILYNPTSQQVLDAIANLPLGLTNQTGADFDPSGVGAIVDNRLQNAARQNLQGIDFSADYQLELGSQDHLQFMATASYLESDRQLSPGQPALQRAGTIFDPPHWRGRTSATWERGNVSLTGVVNHIGGTLDDRFAPFVKVGSFTSIDAIAHVRTADANGPFAGIDVTLAILNLFNEKPALIRNASAAAPPYDATNYPVVGRVVSLTLSKAW
jgi:outer membrane receptor protein involved in Fe transport